MKIAVEGMDGVGKTTVAKYISDRFNCIYIDKPLHFFYNDGPEEQYADLMRVANRMYGINDSIIKSWYFSLGNIYAIRQFQNQDIVIDRHLVSNYYWNGDEASEPIFRTLIDSIGCPDITILLYATPQTRMLRLHKRDPNDPDLEDPDKKDDGHNKMVYFLNKFEIPYVIINTENKTLDEVKTETEEIVSNIKLQKRQAKILEKINGGN